MNDPTARTTISMLETTEGIQLSILYPCDNPRCPEAFHTRNTSDFAEASKWMTRYATHFLSRADARGTG